MVYVLYMIAFYVLYASNFKVLLNNAEQIYRISYYLVAISMCILFVFSKMRLKYWMLSLVCVFIGFLVYKRANDNSILIAIFVILGAQNVDFEKFIKFDLVLRSFLFIFVALSEKFGIIGSTILYRSDGFVRDAFGFLQPNTAGALLLSIYLEYLILRYKKMNFFDYLISICLITFTLLTTNSRSSLLGMILGMFLVFFLRSKIYTYFNNKFINFWIEALFPLLALESYLAVNFFNPALRGWSVLNQLFSGRLNLISYFIKNYPVTLFGQYVQLQDAMNLKSTYFLVIDNGYISVLLKYGLVTLLFFCFFSILYTKKLLSDRNFAYLVPVIVMSFVGLMENTLYYPTYNFTLIFLMTLTDVQTSKLQKSF